jgi:hypothetical protein
MPFIVKSYTPNNLVPVYVYCSRDGMPMAITRTGKAADARQRLSAYLREKMKYWNAGAAAEPRRSPLLGAAEHHRALNKRYNENYMQWARRQGQE